MSETARRHTDESLRIEREHAAEVLEQKGAAADAAINLARAKVDARIAAMRAESDRASTLPGACPAPSRSSRDLEDEAVAVERSVADHAARVERTQRRAQLVSERAVTDQDLVEERAGVDHAIASRDEFLGIASHDLRNMLNVMMGFAALIEQKSVDVPGPIVGYAQRIQRSGARMSRLIGDMVDVASIEAGRLAVTCAVGDPVAVVKEAVEMLQPEASAASILLVTEVPPRSTLAEFDAARIFQVVVNLLSNAIKFTAERGNVIARVDTLGTDVRVAVIDTGVGIAAESLEAIFDPFRQVTTNDRRGMGLGLYICKCIMQGHGGRIWAESTPGVGSTISFTLPIWSGVENTNLPH